MRREALLLVLLLAALAGCAGRAGGEGEGIQGAGGASSVDGEVPVYRGSEVYSPSSIYMRVMGIPEDVEVRVYFVEDATVEEVLEWYRREMEDRGYRAVDEVPVVRVSTPQGGAVWGAVFFERENRGVAVWAYGAYGQDGGGTVYYVATAPMEVLRGEESAVSGTAEGLPASDAVEGEEPVERYPGAVLLAYEKEREYPAPGAYLELTYGTRDAAEDVAAWYRSRLKEQGWEVVEESASRYGVEMYFARGSERLEMSVYPPDESRAYTEIEVSYAPNRLPESDLVEGEEPVERYPGAVMLEYTTVGMGGGRMVSITYGTYDEPAQVIGWYAERLQDAGFMVMERSSSVLSAVKPDAGMAVQVTAERDGYTQVRVEVTSGGGG